MSERSFDVVVLGGGSAGYAAAIRAAELGKSVAIIEQDKLGGTCLHRGCIPTKAMLHVAEVADAARGGEAIGAGTRFDGIDIDRVHEYRDGIVTKKTAGLESLVTARKIVMVRGRGMVVGGRGVRVDSDVYLGTDLILATGAVSNTIGLEIGDRILTSEQALTLTEVPRRVVIIGGGVIGAEFASLWRSFGAEVTIIEGLDHLLPGEDVAISKTLERAFRKRGIQFHLGVHATDIATSTEPGSDPVTVTLTGGKTVSADYLLVAVGRSPATADLGLEEAGIALEHGFVVTDEQLRSSADHVWAVGDIVAGVQLAHRGFQHGIFVAERIAGLNPTWVPDAHIPKVTYTHPEVASVGVSEKAAVSAFGADSIETVEYNLAGNGKSSILGTAGLVKVVRQKNGPVLGVHLIGDRVSELITEGQLAVGWDAHPEDFAPLIHAHPTQSEALGEAFLALSGKPLHAL